MNMKTTIDYKQLHLTPIEELIDADFGKPGTAERKEFDEKNCANYYYGIYIIYSIITTTS